MAFRACQEYTLNLEAFRPTGVHGSRKFPLEAEQHHLAGVNSEPISFGLAFGMAFGLSRVLPCLVCIHEHAVVQHISWCELRWLLYMYQWLALLRGAPRVL